MCVGASRARAGAAWAGAAGIVGEHVERTYCGVGRARRRPRRTASLRDLCRDQSIDPRYNETPYSRVGRHLDFKK